MATLVRSSSRLNPRSGADPLTQPTTSRRDFLTAAAATATALSALPAVHAGGNDGTLKVGLIGCGSRGTGAAEQALRADKNVKLVALGDMFEDKIKGDSAKEMKGAL